MGLDIDDIGVRYRWTDTDIGMTVQPIKIQRSVQTQMRCKGRKGDSQIYI